jgi:hypothetical protein
MALYRLVLLCDGVPTTQGAQAAVCITADFSERTWHQNALCQWDGKCLNLTVENDFDDDGRATMDEFSDELCACVAGGFGGDLRIISVTEIGK